MNARQIERAPGVTEPEILVAASKSYADEALEVIAEIMRKSENEKTRLLAAGLLLDRAGDRMPPSTALHSVPKLEGDMGKRIRAHMADHYMRQFSALTMKEALGLKSPASAVLDKLNELVKLGQIRSPVAGMFQALPP